MNNQRFHTALRTPAGSPLEEFMLLNGRYSNFTKETCFIRYAGGQNCEAAVRRLRSWADRGQSGCVFVPALKPQPSAQEVSKYVALYRDGRATFPFSFQNGIWQNALETGFERILELFQRVRGRSEEAIVRNFAVKILYWMDTYFPRLFTETAKMNRFPKFACGGQLKLTEYLFLYLLFLLGCDVLHISPEGDAGVTDPELLSLSLRVEGETPPCGGGEPSGDGRVVISMDRIQRPERHRSAASPPSRAASPAAPSPPRANPTVTLPPREHPTVTVPPRAPAGRAGARQPLEFEELARFASSVVMLKVFDRDDRCFKTGSGVIISNKGYVLTNMHVVSGGHYYGILLEEETDIFYTNELIKYHQDYDLAILRMQKRRTPVPISRGEKKLVRGQKVVAIGSPLGLFNSVSDGIISGFRQLEMVSMIQFTAPVSHGSSGGALLDMYGELIGLITGGYDDGQNLNLAVDYQTISQFVRGLI